MKLILLSWQTIFRMAKRYRSTFVINLVGLSTGLACALLIFLWISDELAFDKFHRYDSRLYQVMVNQSQGGQINTSDGTNGLLGEIIKKGLPEVEYAVSTTPPNWFRKFNVTWRNNTVSAVGNFVGQDYFNVFSYDLLQGKPGSVLTDKHAIVLSRGLAMKLFNTTDDVIGKTLEWKWASVTRQSLLRVSAPIFLPTPVIGSILYCRWTPGKMFYRRAKIRGMAPAPALSARSWS
jgi:putative ABC transport system permease protein